VTPLKFQCIFGVYSNNLALQVSFYVTRPMITLLRVVQRINSGKLEDDTTPLLGGSREIHQVYNTFAKLCKVVRVSNTAFFSGNLQWAFHFVDDALKLFRKIDDQKAVGIACNNLGNILFAMNREWFTDELICTESKTEAHLDTVQLALNHYNEAIRIGERDFDDAEVELKAEYASQIADRLFNRGLFLLLIAGEDGAPADARERGYADIARTRSLDYDVKDYWMEHKLLLKNSVNYFSRLLRRISGLADFFDDIGLNEIWDVKELIEDADQLLFAAWNEPNAPLFESVNRVGRLQQLEGVAISLSLKMGNEMEAARLGMRMFSEDQYILESSFVLAAEALLPLMRDNDSVTLTKKTTSCMRNDLRRMLKRCKNVSLNIGKCLVFSVELSERWEGDPLLEKINANSLKLYDRHCAPHDHMGVVAYSTKESLTVDLGIKADNEGRQRTLLDIATTSTTERANPAFPLAVQMIVDSQASFDSDSFILLIFDGYAWDGEACASLGAQIQRLNSERSTMIHLFGIGLDVEDEGARQQCKELSKISKSSFYVDGTLENMDSIFDSIAVVISGRPANTGSLKGLTMEKF
jgi:hypothetical protein